MPSRPRPDGTFETMPTVAYRAVRSRRKFIKAPQIKKCLEAQIDAKVKPVLLGDFEAVVANWKSDVRFKARKFITYDGIALNIYPDGADKKIWEYVSLGTEGPYPITAVNFMALSFMLGYSPKTRPVGQYGGSGSASGPAVTVKSVMHPGIAPRFFELAIRLKRMDWYSRTMEGIWRQCIRAA